MKKIFNFFATILLLIPILAKADNYPINKNIDIKHYVFQLRLTDSNDEIIGTTQVTVNFKLAGMQNFRLDLINKTTEKKDKGMVVEGVSISNTAVNYTHENDALIIYLPKNSVVNRDCKAHDLKNLYIVDSSIFVTSAGVNPENTIQALALRAGDAIAQRLSGDKNQRMGSDIDG